MSDLPLSKTLRELRERGLENVFQRFYSLYQGKVTRTNDDLALGRSTVKMESLGFPDEHPDFSDVLTPYGGEDFGFFFPPYEEDDVLVTFDHGDISSPIVVGASWATDDQKRISDSQVPVEFIKTITTDEGQEVGDVPTVRGIKLRNGSALIFDETEDLEHVELWSGESQGKGKRAIKHHRLRLDDRADNGQVVLATFGDENPNAETISDEDSPDERDRKELEGRLRHQILMRDTSDDRFIQVKTIGEDDQLKFLSFLMSDTEKKIRAQSANEHFFEIDDENDKTEWSVKNGFRWLLDQANNFMLGETPDGRRLTMSDQDSSILLESPDGQSFEFNTSETRLQDDQHDININTTQNLNVESGIDSNFTIKGNLNIDTQGSWMATVQAMYSLMVTGNIQIQGAQITISSGQVMIGQGNIQRLLNETALATFNSHTHQYLLPLHPVASIPTATPLVPMIPGNDTTVATSAG